MFEEKIIELLKEYAYETTDEGIYESYEEDEKEGFVDVIFDVTVEGLAMHFNGIQEEDLEDYFKENFNYYATNTIYKTEDGWYLVTQL